MRRLAARELHRHLPPRLERDRVVQQRPDVVPRQLVHEPDLVGVHEARVAHHVAAVRQVDRQHRAAAVLDRAAAVVVQLLVVVRLDVAARERLLEVLEERRVDRHHVLEVAVLRAVLDHQDPAVALDDLRLDLADLLVEQDLVVALPVEDLLPGLAHADRAERIGLARPAQRRLHLLPRFLQRQIRPPGHERVPGLHPVQRVERDPRPPRHVGKALLDVLDGFVHGRTIAGPSRPGRRKSGKVALAAPNGRIRAPNDSTLDCRKRLRRYARTAWRPGRRDGRSDHARRAPSRIARIAA
jgi:hypothetical protein